MLQASSSVVRQHSPLLSPAYILLSPCYLGVTRDNCWIIAGRTRREGVLNNGGVPLLPLTDYNHR